MSTFAGMDEDALTELLETAETSEGYADVVGVMVHACSGSCEDGPTVGEAAGDGEEDIVVSLIDEPIDCICCISGVSNGQYGGEQGGVRCTRGV